MGYGLFFWAPSFLVRSFHLTLLHASLGFGGLVLVGGLIGIWFGGVLADRYGEKRRGMYAFIPAMAFLATVPFYVAGVLSTTLWISFAVLLVPTALGLGLAGPGAGGGPAPRPRQHARHGLGAVLVHQQSHRHRTRHDVDRRGIGLDARCASARNRCAMRFWPARAFT